MEPRHIVAGQFVREEKVAFSRQLRRDRTPAERLLWSHLRGRRLGGFRFRRQQIIEGYIADFYCAETGLVIELDGPIHEQQAEADGHRDAVLANHKLTILRVKNERVLNDVAGVLAEITACCRQTSPPTPRHRGE
ncbi:endonuclease domain-containing protein [Fimbriiglobus ruber]|uniref:DUF559 domain-containing protein n=1 Tax=Fimbriiglobus ruber TaxID=1908690 RepID=A0A225D9C4_9BACT|nr:DUF559 domain-containing protein [Fimbriiglobus ruber]OWK38161.1 hypothetical protein FRUB_07281 [Fimbriiglobus ruber]